MAAVYEYVCRACGKVFETDKIVSGKEFRHMKDDSPELEVCGVVTRNWAAVNFNRVPGGGRRSK